MSLEKTIATSEEVELQEWDRLHEVALYPEYSYRIGYAKPRISYVSPQCIHLDSAVLTSSIKKYEGEWRVTNKVSKARALLRYQVTAFGKGLKGVPVTLMDRDFNVLGTKVTDDEGYVTFEFTYDNPGVYVYNAVIGEGRVKPLTYLSPRVSRIVVTVWLVKVKQVASTDVWLRWVGRTLLEPLPHDFWKDLPRSIVGLAHPKYSRAYHMLVPVISGLTVNLELGVSAACNLPKTWGTKEECCRYAKGTWWTYKVLVKKSLKSDWVEVGTDKINLDYHMKFKVTTSDFTYKGKCLSLTNDGEVRCAWEKGTAPTC